MHPPPPAPEQRRLTISVSKNRKYILTQIIDGGYYGKRIHIQIKKER